MRVILKETWQHLRGSVWNYGAEGAGISLGVAAAGTWLTHFIGGWDNMVKALIWCMALDFLLGILAALKAKRIDSQVMFWGGVNKVLVLAFVGFGVILDGLVGMQQPYIRTAIICFYIGREGLSLVENYGKLGNTLPSFITDFLSQLKDKGDKGGAISKEDVKNG